MTFDPAPGGWGAGNYVPSGASASPAVSWPPGFDPEEFLKGATTIYTRLQTSWDKRDIEDIRMFTSPEVFAEIQRQAKEDPTPGKTELLMINPSIVEARDVGNQTVVSVRYDVTLREDTDTVAKQVLELWHFSRDRNNPNDFWMLEGIQQME
ncbi:39S ribosomal protein L45 [Desulfosarcina sp. OttesenSCG-928-A07]|nr:39S ribosomal protein L45 [Desulfosarcina sp. OttesenSCG-928-A07]